MASNSNAWSHQIELAEDLKRYLHGLQERLGAVAQYYMKKCDSLRRRRHDAGGLVEIHAGLCAGHLS